jgi:hypothetical protein
MVRKIESVLKSFLRELLNQFFFVRNTFPADDVAWLRSTQARLCR